MLWWTACCLSLLVIPARGEGPEEYARVARTRPGDPLRGRANFADPKRPGCIRCHRTRRDGGQGNGGTGEGGDLGPDLSDIGGKFDRELLIESILEPSKQIVEGYRTTVVVTSKGIVLAGIVREETAEAILLAGTDGKIERVLRAEIVERRFADTSLMAQDLIASLAPPEFADLIAYLQSLRSSGQGTPGSGVSGPVALPAGFEREVLAQGLTGATAMESAPGGRVFICEQTGALRILKDGRLLPEPFALFKVDSFWERGLIGVTLDPRFAENGWLYAVYISPDPYPHHRISRLTARGDVAEPGSERILFEGDDQGRLGGTVPAGHQGGGIHFARDGKLLIGIGEQTAGEPAQRLDTLQGKLLRLEPDGTIPKDNPFLGRTQGKYGAIWALGLRNPFTFAVDPRTGRILINDVGQDRWEEIDEGFAGANYGWPIAEGPTTDPRFRGPIHHYPAASIAGGAFCPGGPGSNFPEPYRGRYFFADFVRGWIKHLDPEHPEDVEIFATGLTRPVDLRFAPDGSLLVLVRDAWVKDGNFHGGTGSLQRIYPR